MNDATRTTRSESSPLGAETYEQTLGCVHCGLCLPACPTYRSTGVEADSPRGRIYLVRALAEGRVEDPEVVRHHLDRCLDCRACETACPSGVHYGAILESSRAALETQKPATGLRARIAKWMLRHVVVHQGRLRAMFAFLRAAEVLGLRRLARLLRLLPASVDAIAPRVPNARDRAPLPTGWHRPPSPSRGKVALFTGCVMEAVFGRINRATLQLLLANGFEVFVPAAQRCCGALLVHAGLPKDAAALARENTVAFAEVEFVINNSAGCGCAMREYGELLGDEAGRTFAAKCRDISEFLAEVGLTATPKACSARVAYDDPCHLCHGQKVRTQPRTLLQQVPGLQLVAHARPEDCCGSAGIYNMLQPELASDVGQRKAKALADAEPDLVATGNPGCMMQIAAHLAAVGSTARVVHPVELLLPDEPRESTPTGI
ncbi:MAG: (Fe-S)-binding protein [Planctomycetota bacterium]